MRGRPVSRRVRWLAFFAALGLQVVALSARSGGVPPGARPLRRISPQVVATYPHDHAAFTQGLVWSEGRLFESTGLYGASSLREVDLTSGRVLRRVELPADLFAEGLARHGQELLQLTWQEQRLLVWDLPTFARRGERRYGGEGWGLTSDGTRLLMSDGTDRISIRDPSTFAETGSIRVTRDGLPLPALNELEWAEGRLWANVWMTDEIVGIDATTGRVEVVVDGSSLLDADARREADVLNGIAYVPARKTFLLTGKYWPTLFEVRFDESATAR